MMANVFVVSDFFNCHPKRFGVLKNKVSALLPHASHTRLIDVCRTHWVARIDRLYVFIQIFAAVVAALEAIQDNADKSWSPESMRDASFSVLSITSFRFILSLIVVSRCLEVTRPLKKQLQTPTMDVV